MVMSRSEAGKLGRIAVNKKYSTEQRKEWSVKGAIKLNKILSNKHRSIGGKTQSKESKALGAFNSAKNKGLTESETIVKNFIEKIGYTCSIDKNSDFEIHCILKTKYRPFEIDFVKFYNGIPEIIIEVTSQKSEMKGESLAFKFIKLKESYPNLKTISIVSNRMINSGLTALKNECDHVLFLENLTKHELEKIL